MIAPPVYINRLVWKAWILFASFWALFLTTPGPNAINCVIVSEAYVLRHGLICVQGLICMVAILTQADLFLTLSGFGITALLSISSLAFQVLEWIGAGFFIYIAILC